MLHFLQVVVVSAELPFRVYITACPLASIFLHFYLLDLFSYILMIYAYSFLLN